MAKIGEIVKISAQLVQELRMKTSAPMMDCKKALVEANGDLTKALELLQVRLGNKVSKAASRIAAEGVIVSHVQNNIGVLLEVNCETDFVAKQDDFFQFAQKVAEAAATANANDLEVLKTLPLNGGTVESERVKLVSKIGENIHIRRFVRCETPYSMAAYTHNKSKGALVEYKSKDNQLGKNVAMHIVAMNPLALSAKEIPSELLAEKRHIFEMSVENSDKPANIIAKMVEGNMSKYLKEVSLLDQSYIYDNKQSILQMLKDNDAVIHSFTRYELGEGIEKHVKDFATEVAEQIAAVSK